MAFSQYLNFKSRTLQVRQLYFATKIGGKNYGRFLTITLVPLCYHSQEGPPRKKMHFSHKSTGLILQKTRVYLPPLMHFESCFAFEGTGPQCGICSVFFSIFWFLRRIKAFLDFLGFDFPQFSIYRSLWFNSIFLPFSTTK